VRSHGGFVDVYSEMNRGTTFKIYLPVQTGEPEVSRVEQPPEFPRGNGECILVVDDEASVREITRDTLENYGYRVLTANDGTEALAMYAQRQEDIRLVITDMMMPFLDGMATIRALQKINPRVLIIASSGMAPNEELMKSTGMVQEFLNKPYTTEKLLKSLYRALTTPTEKKE
jgi:two-component system, cell cycle sensor histidine kinase and response regulator CckA